MFDAEIEGHPEAKLLESIVLTNATLAPLLIALAIDEEGGEHGKVDFGDLGVRHLGTLYEGLLSYSVHIAEEDLTIDKDGNYIPAKTTLPLVIHAGRPHLLSPTGARKTSGSYFTPSFIVRRLIQNALQPTLEEHLARVYDLPSEQQWEVMLDFKVVDPAMGSGHFLVDALDTIADRFATFLREHPRISARPLIDARECILTMGRTAGVEAMGNTLSDYDLLRRIVLKRCIFRRERIRHGGTSNGAAVCAAADIELIQTLGLVPAASIDLDQDLSDDMIVDDMIDDGTLVPAADFKIDSLCGDLRNDISGSYRVARCAKARSTG